MDDPVPSLLELLERRHDHLTTAPGRARQLAAGGLMRAEALLRGLRILIQAGRADLAGLLIRAIWECWVIGVYLLLGGEEASEHVMASYRHHIETYWNNWPADVVPAPELDEEFWNEWTEPRRLRFDKVSETVEALLQETDQGPIEYSGISSYDVLYRLESMFSAHAGMALFDRYVEPATDERPYERVIAAPMLQVPVERLEAMAAVWVAHLAWFVFREFGMSTSELQAPFMVLIGDARMIGH
jgi:hypothetical protein